MSDHQEGIRGVSYVSKDCPIDHISKGNTGDLLSLLKVSIDQITPFVANGDNERAIHRNNAPISLGDSSLLNPLSLSPELLKSNIKCNLDIPDEGLGINGFENTLRDILKYSVNPMAPGFMDKLYAAPLPPGIVAELILGILNTNVHVYQVSPVLTTIEKSVTKRLAHLFGFNGPKAGGISTQGGSASNMTSIVVARNILYPETKTMGNTVNGQPMVMFTSRHGHYSIEKAAQSLGFGSSAVITVPTDMNGRMRSDELDRLINEAKAHGKLPFYVNATAGTTVLGSFDPFEEIWKITRRHRCWFHVDGAWGGSFAFSHKDGFRTKLQGSHLADSIAINPHKMLGVPLTCSFLLTRDLRLFHDAMTSKAGYLFHDPQNDDHDHVSNGDDELGATKDTTACLSNQTSVSLYDIRDDDSTWREPLDLADMTLQCGRRGDSLKLFMVWQYYGTEGLARMLENAYDIALHLNNLIDAHSDLTLVLGHNSKPSCLQVCFHYTPNGKFVFGPPTEDGSFYDSNDRSKESTGKQNTRVTARISRALIPKGFMVDFAPALEGQEDRGAFLRVVVNISTIRETIERLVEEVVITGRVVAGELQRKRM